VTQLEEVPLAEAAKALGISWHRAWRLLLMGQLDGRKCGGRWVVSRVDVERAAKRALGANQDTDSKPR